MKKSIKIIFTLSILLNVVLVGVVGGFYYKKMKWQHGGYGLSHNKILAEKMNGSREEMREKFKAMKNQFEALEDVIEAPEFDLNQYNRAVDNIVSAKNEMARRKATIMGEALSTMTLDERKKLSKEIARSLSGRHKSKYGHGGDKKPE